MKLPIWNSLSPRKRKLLGWATGLVIFYAVLGFLILPPIVRSVAVKQVSQLLGREVAIEKVRLNPFALSTAVNGLLIKDADGEPFVSWDKVYVNFEIKSLFGGALTFKEITIEKPFARAVMNQDGTFNFTDIIEKFSTNTSPAQPEPAPKESKPFVLHVGRLQISGAAATTQDLTRRTPFKRRIGPFDLALQDFRTDPDSKNPCSFQGTTDAGGDISWNGNISLGPFRSTGELRLFHFAINQYAPLYQEFVKFEIPDGKISLKLKYEVDLSTANPVCRITDSAIGLRDFKLAPAGGSNNIIVLPAFSIAGVSADMQKRQATIGAILVSDAKVSLIRDQNAAINVVEAAQPAPARPDASQSSAILLLLQSVTNAVTSLINSTNQWSGAVREVNVTNCAVHLADFVNSRPARLDLEELNFVAKNISNLPGTNLEAALSLRWNTNGSIKIATTASFVPPTADVRFDLDQLDLGSLDPYLEPKLNLFVLGSKIGLHGLVKLRTPENGLPEVTFAGDASLDDFRTVDGVSGGDLVKWQTLHFKGIDASLNPPGVALKEIAVDSLYVRLAVETNKTINLLNALRLTSTNAPATNETEVVAAPPAGEDARPAEAKSPATNAPAMKVSIGAVTFTNTAFVFSDHSLKPEVNLAIRDFHGRVAGLTTEQLPHADIALGAKVDGVGPVSITGALNSFDDAQTNTLNISFKDVDLTAVSPYAGKFAGYRIAQGKLNLDLDYLIVGKNLQSKNVITIDQFNFGEKVESPDATKLPVRLAVAIMKDREGKIVLDVPVEGRLDDPQFRVRKVVWRAVENILVKAATSPFSLLGAVLGGGGEELGWQEFSPGSAELTADGMKKLDSLQKALFDRPALRLEITGGIDPDADREGLQRAALDRDIRARLWQKLSKAERATSSVDQLPLAPEIRAEWVRKIYDEAVAAGKINAQFIAANTNLAALAAEVLPKTSRANKGAALLRQTAAPKTTKPDAAAKPVYQTRLVPPPDAFEAVLLATIPVSNEAFESLAAARAKNVQNYLIETGKVDAGRLFLKAGQMENLRQDGSRAWLQLQ
jgi:hypothetical protein